jgi:hypothetical protein
MSSSVSSIQEMQTNISWDGLIEECLKVFTWGDFLEALLIAFSMFFDA